MKYYELELNGRTIRLRLTSGDCMVIEDKSKTKMLKYIQDSSISTLTNLLMYMVRSSDPTFNIKQAGALFDELVDAGYTIETILYDVIYEGLVVSGFLTKDQLEEIKMEKEDIKKTVKEETMK